VSFDLDGHMIVPGSPERDLRNYVATLERPQLPGTSLRVALAGDRMDLASGQSTVPTVDRISRQNV
jgi:hypothetical protein